MVVVVLVVVLVVEVEVEVVLEVEVEIVVLDVVELDVLVVVVDPQVSQSVPEHPAGQMQTKELPERTQVPVLQGFGEHQLVEQMMPQEPLKPIRKVGGGQLDEPGQAGLAQRGRPVPKSNPSRNWPGGQTPQKLSSISMSKLRS